MKKIQKLGILLAILMAVSSFFAVSALETVETIEETSAQTDTSLAAAVDAQLVFLQDFDQLPLGKVTLSQIVNLVPGDNSTFTLLNGTNEGLVDLVVMQDEGSNNKYLKVTIQGNSHAIGVRFPANLALMSFEFKQDDGKNTHLYGVNANTGAAAAASFLEGNMDWTLMTKHNNYATGVGLGTGGLVKSFYVDNFKVWTFTNEGISNLADRVADTHKSAISKTISFASSTKDTDGKMIPEENNVTTPLASINKNAWCNLYNGQSNVTANLSTLVPTAVPTGYIFAGWSYSDNGAKIGMEYNAFKMPGDITLYALWEKPKPIAMYEDFEGFEVGQTVSTSDFSFLKLNQHVISGFAAEIVLDPETGSKCLKISGAQYVGFLFDNRRFIPGKEFAKFDYKKAEGSAGLAIYTGDAHTGTNQKQWPGNTKWACVFQESDPSAKVFGAFIQNSASKYEFYIDNVYYWAVPEGTNENDMNVTITFANSTGAPEVTLPVDTFELPIWTSTDYDVDLTDTEFFAPVSNDPLVCFKGFSYTDGGSVITEMTNFRFIKDQTLYAVWGVNKPEMLNGASVKFSNNAVERGMRFASLVSLDIKNNEATSEYGFIVTRDTLLSLAGLTAETFTLDSEVSFLRGKAYSKAEGIDLIYDASGENITEVEAGKNIAVTALLYNIPEGNYAENLIVKPYMIVGGNTYYGTAKVDNFKAVLTRIANAGGSDYTENKDFIDSVIE